MNRITSDHMLWAIYVLSVCIEMVFVVSRFILVHTITMAMFIHELVLSINWYKINQYRNTIGSYFVYAYE